MVKYCLKSSFYVTEFYEHSHLFILSAFVLGFPRTARFYSHCHEEEGRFYSAKSQDLLMK